MCIGCWSKEKLSDGDSCTLVFPNHMLLTWTQTVVTNSPGEEEEEQYKLLYVLVELRQHTKYYPKALEVFPIETYGELQCNNNMGSYRTCLHSFTSKRVSCMFRRDTYIFYIITYVRSR